MCRNILVDKLVKECTKVVDGDEIHNKTLNVISSNDCASCIVYIVLFAVFLTTIVIIGSAFIYLYLYKENKQLNLKKRRF